MYINKYYPIIIFFLLVIFNNRLFSQFNEKYFLQFGLTTLHVLGDNSATKPIIESNFNEQSIVGGSFNGNQPGLTLRLIMALDSTERLTVPIGMDLTYFEALERYPVPTDSIYNLGNVLVKYKHTIINPTIVAGVNYTLVSYPKIKGKIFAGLEARASFFVNPNLQTKLEFLTLDSTFTVDTNAKASAFRLGGAFRFGIEGQIFKNWKANISGALGIINIIGRNNERGELLTPFKKTALYYEDKESYIYNFLFTMSVIYSL
jgi:hypothetical protein